MITSIWWIRRDLRLFDNPALTDAVNNADQVIPLFILDTAIMESDITGLKRKAFLLSGLARLDEDLKTRGGKLIIRQGDPVQVFSDILAELKSNETVYIYCEENYTSYSQKRDSKVKQKFPLIKSGSPAILPPGFVLKKDKTAYTIYTPYKNSWYSIASLSGYRPAPSPISIKMPPNVESLPIPTIDLQPKLISSGEQFALARLEWFMSGENAPIMEYTKNRNIPSIDGTSKLSPYLRFGMLSPKYLFSKALELLNTLDNTLITTNIRAWLDELVWRDFYFQILYHFPFVRNQNFRNKHIDWLNDKNNFNAWCKGETGFPIIDAAMRQLLDTGWMHNRLRMVVASFLTKNLLTDWRWGEKYFLQHLIDGDIASNNGGWQWCASTGTDAVPYFRIFNPIAQGKKFDPHGDFIRTWLPELSGVKNKYIHEPWLMPTHEQNICNCHIGKEYPFPIVDLIQSRYRALNAFIS